MKRCVSISKIVLWTLCGAFVFESSDGLSKLRNRNKDVEIDLSETTPILDSSEKYDEETATPAEDLSQWEIAQADIARRKKVQEDIIERSEEFGSAAAKQKNALSDLRKVNLLLTESCLEKIKDANEAGLSSAVLQVDVCELHNWKNLLVHVLRRAAGLEKFEGRFIMDQPQDVSLQDRLMQNQDAHTHITDFISYLQKTDYVSEIDDIVAISRYLERISKSVAEDKKLKTHSFANFISTAIKVCNVLKARIMTAEILEAVRKDSEDSVQKTISGSELHASASVSSGIVGGKATFTRHNKSQMDDTSFYTVRSGKGFKLNINVSLGAFRVSAYTGFDRWPAAIFYTLEQYLDSGKVEDKLLLDSNTREAYAARGAMQKAEKELLALFSNIESYAKAFEVVPVSVSVVLPSITRSSFKESAAGLSKYAAFDVSAFDALGATVQLHHSNQKYTLAAPLLDLVHEDCSPVDGYADNGVANCIGLIGDKERYDGSNRYLKTFEDGHIIGAGEMEAILPIILGDLRLYVSTLQALAQDKDDKDASKKKHDIERVWCPSKLYKSEGRLGVFKAMMVTLMQLRRNQSNDRVIELFRQAYVELQKLSQLCEFSKNESHKMTVYSRNTTVTTDDLEAAFKLQVPVLGEISVTLLYEHVNGHPNMSGNDKFLTAKLVLPMAAAGIVGTAAIQRALHSAAAKVGAHNEKKMDVKQSLFVLADALNLVGGNNVSLTGAELQILGYSEISVKMRLMEEHVNDNSAVIGTPFENLSIKPASKAQWRVMYVQSLPYTVSSALSTATVHTAIGGANTGVTAAQGILSGDLVPGALSGAAEKVSNAITKISPALSTVSGVADKIAPLSVGYSSKFGKLERIVGSNMLWYVLLRYNTFALGMLDRPSQKRNTAWLSFVNEQAGQLNEIFTNIGSDKCCELHLELLDIYNNVEVSHLSEMQGAMEDLLRKCKALADAEDGDKEESYRDALQAFEKVADLNFKHVFIPHRKKEYGYE